MQLWFKVQMPAPTSPPILHPVLTRLFGKTLRAIRSFESIHSLQSHHNFEDTFDGRPEDNVGGMRLESSGQQTANNPLA